MLVKDLQSAIKNNNIPHIIILSGEEVAVKEIYIDKVFKALPGNVSILRCNSVLDSYGIVSSKGLQNAARAVLVRNDSEFLKNEKAWQKVFNLFENTGDYLILSFNSIDKRGKFYKKYSDNIIQFEKLSPSIICKHIKYLGLPDNIVKTFIEYCGGDYSTVLNEADKIVKYADFANISNEESFKILVKEKVIHPVVGDITFKFTDSILVRNKKNTLKYLVQSKEIGESPILTLSVLYNGFKNILLVQGLGNDTKDMSKRTGLTPFQCKMAKEKVGYYSIEELVEILHLIQEREVGVKRGQYEMETVIDDLLLHIM